MATDKDLKKAVEHMKKENRLAKQAQEILPEAPPLPEKPTLTFEEWRAERVAKARLKAIGF